ncbi:hypothetical protein D3C73_1345320 [compost metagenome]
MFVQAGQCRGVGAVGDQQQGAWSFFRCQQALGLLDHRADVFPRFADQFGAQRLDEGVEQGRIVRRRQHQMRATGVGDQRIARTGATLDQVMQLMLGRFQATRLHVGGIHGRRQVNGDDQWRPVLQEVRAILFPGRPGGGNRTDHQQCADQVHRA